MKNKITKIVSSIALIIFSYGFIFYKILNIKEFVDFNIFYQFTYSNLVLILFVLMLMILNWSVETLKWKILIEKIQILKFRTALKAVFSGIAFGIFTPNRIGDIGGRVFFIEKGKRTYGILATGIGSFAQFLTTIIAGIIGFILFLFLFPEKTILNPFLNKITGTILFFSSLILIWIYFNIKKIKSILLKISFFVSRKNQLEYLSETKLAELLKVLLLSFARYLIFSSQFYLLLQLFDINLTLIQAYISISLIYLFNTIIPTTTLIELGIRGSLAIFFIGMFSNNILSIILSASILWIINLAIPAIIGSVFFLRNQFK